MPNGLPHTLTSLMLFTQPWQLLVLSQFNTFLFIIQDLVWHSFLKPLFSLLLHAGKIPAFHMLSPGFPRPLYNTSLLSNFQFNKYWLSAPDVPGPVSSHKDTAKSKGDGVSGLVKRCFSCYIRSSGWEGFLFINLLSSICALWEVLNIHIK